MIPSPVLLEVSASPPSASGSDRCRLAKCASATTIANARSPSLQARPVAYDVAFVVGRLHLPARRVHAAAPGGVVEDAVDVHVGVAGVCVHGDVLAGAGDAPALELPGGL